MLQLKNITKDYVLSSETVNALRGVSISFRKQEFVSILGPSGCGKTTLLNIIGGLDHYTSGDLVIAGRSTRYFNDRDWDVYRNHRIGFIFQSYNLIPHQTILENVELALTIAGCPKEERVRRAKEALDRVGLAKMYNKRPNQLSGGQCQRVAIARALVNDPEILLADEPTGALDTVTSVQIMNLIREISGERLVIMVTHNPELAEKYSSRIVRLLDGQVVEDTNPYSADEETEECKALLAEHEEELRVAVAEAEKNGKRPPKNVGKEKAKMSLLTAFRLSAKNLLSKRGRTAMVGFAGSIGIIGIALVLAFSAGIKGYVASMQDDMLSGNPVTISEATLDFNAISDMMDTEQKIEIVKSPNRVYINSTVEYLAKMNKNVNSMIVKNDLTEDYVNYVKAMPQENYAAMLFDYGIDMTVSLFTDFSLTKNGDPETVSIHRLTGIYKSILSETDFKEYADYVSTLAPSFKQAPNNADYIEAQYDVLAGKIATEKNEVMLVLSSDEELSDLLLARLGFYTQDEFLSIVDKAGGNEYDESLYRDSFSYDELLDKKFYFYPNDSLFTVSVEGMMTTVAYNSAKDQITDDEGMITLKVAGILRPKETVSYGCLSSGIYYTEALTDYILDVNEDCDFFSFLMDETRSAGLAMKGYQIGYDYYYTFNGETNKASETIGPDMTSSMLAAYLAGGSGMGSTGSGTETGTGAGTGMGAGTGSGMSGLAGSIDLESMRNSFIRLLGGNKVANDISIYPISFEAKDLVTEYLDRWNGDEDVTVGDKTLTNADRAEVKYTDTLALVITLINTFIDVVSYALIAFTSVSLVVSTIMIGIITYVSVVERIKEIGVIRSLGGRKRDVSHLFNAEALIIGTLAGVFGIAATYLVSAIVNAVLYPLIHVPNIAALPASQAIALIVLSIALTSISGLIPASSAAKKDPVVALRTE